MPAVATMYDWTWRTATLAAEYRCEAIIGWETWAGAPVGIKCHKPAKLYGVAALCEDCAKVILKSKPKAS